MAAQTLGPVRKALQLDDVSKLERILQTFVKIAQTHPELIFEHHLGAYTKARVLEVEEGLRKGANKQQTVEFHIIDAEGLIERVLNAKGDK